MRLLKIKPTYFRGYQQADWIPLDSNLVLLAGPNGYGKSSLAEAIEWLFYGRTKRRERGEDLSKLDYRGSYRNVHAPDDIPTSVEAQVRLANGDRHTLKRTLHTEGRGQERTETSVDGDEKSLRDYGSVTDPVHDPVVAQHTLKYFIHATPKERRDRISAALGLDPLVQFKTALDGGRRRFMQSPPQRVANAKKRLDDLLSDMRVEANFQGVVERWAADEFSLRDDYRRIETLAREHLSIESEAGYGLIRALQVERNKIASRLFDTSQVLPPSGLNDHIQLLEEASEEVGDRVEALEAAARTFVEETESVYSQTRLSFWETGLEIAEGMESEQCPMCGELTLPDQKKEALRQRIGDAQEYSEASDALEEQIEEFEEWIGTTRATVTSVYPAFLDDEERSALQDLLSDEYEESLVEFMGIHDSTETTYDNSIETLDDIADRIGTLNEKLKDPEQVASALTFIEGLADQFSETVEKSITSAAKYRDYYNNFFTQTLDDVISGADEIEQIDAYLTPLVSRNTLRILAEYQDLIDDSLGLVKELDEYIEGRQTEKLSKRGKDIEHYYKLLNPGADVVFDRIEWGTDSATLWGQSFGVDMNAVSNFSQAQLNCLGLSLHLMRSRNEETPFGFLVLDDPVQSMDVDHAEALITDLFDELLGDGIQLLVFSQVQGLVDRIYNLHYAEHPRRLRISDFGKEGPVVEDAETLQLAIERAKQLAQRNEDHRREAVLLVRRSIEMLTQELCRETNSTQPPADATVGNMLPYFERCPNSSPKQSSRLRDTKNFTDPAAHEDPNWQVPTESQIRPHIDRLETYAKTLSVW